MCGIVAYIGPREAYPIILKGLKRLEYRGYDSAGIALLNSGLKVYKKKGKVAMLEETLQGRFEVCLILFNFATLKVYSYVYQFTALIFRKLSLFKR